MSKTSSLFALAAGVFCFGIALPCAAQFVPVEPPPVHFEPPPVHFDPPPVHFDPPPVSLDPPPFRFDPPPVRLDPPVEASTATLPPAQDNPVARQEVSKDSKEESPELSNVPAAKAVADTTASGGAQDLPKSGDPGGGGSGSPGQSQGSVSWLVYLMLLVFLGVANLYNRKKTGRI
jgi:hypothetical protein